MSDQEILYIGMFVSALLGGGLLLTMIEFRRMSAHPERYKAQPGWWAPELRGTGASRVPAEAGSAPPGPGARP